MLIGVAAALVALAGRMVFLQLNPGVWFYTDGLLVVLVVLSLVTWVWSPSAKAMDIMGTLLTGLALLAWGTVVYTTVVTPRWNLVGAAMWNAVMFAWLAALWADARVWEWVPEDEGDAS